LGRLNERKLVLGQATGLEVAGKEKSIMLYYFKVRVEPKDWSFDEMWDRWEKQAEAAVAAKASGKMVALYKVAGQRLVIGVIDAESHDELDQIFMAALPIAHNLEFVEILPVREYENFANDVKRRWKPEEKP
jgi:muconolactone delta-isomerase